VNNVRRFAIGLAIACSAAIVAAEALRTVTFEHFSQGSPNGQFGWKSTGSDGPSCAGQSYDHMVAPNTTRFESFGRQSLRISNAVTSNCLHDQTFSAPVIDEAGETKAYDAGVPRGVRERSFVFEFDLASTLPASPQECLQVIVSADNGAGGRLSWVQMADAADGLKVTFADYQDRPPYGSQANPANGRGPEDGFFFSTVASGLHRSAKHHVRVEHSFNDGPHNDVVIVSVDQDKFVHRGTSWEDYFRWQQGPGDPQQTAPVRESRVARSILFHSRGIAAPNTLGFGFAFDNVSQASGPIQRDQNKCHDDRGDGHHDRRRDRDDDRDGHHGCGGHDHHDGRHDRDDDHGRHHDGDDDHNDKHAGGTSNPS
jgi:hypothetical protein